MNFKVIIINIIIKLLFEVNGIYNVWGWVLAWGCTTDKESSVAGGRWGVVVSACATAAQRGYVVSAGRGIEMR